MYLEGAILFVIGGAMAMTKANSHVKELRSRQLVDAPYLLGGVCFTLGSYAGILEVVNVPNKDSKKIDYCFYGRK